jgi:hypothetical protein
MCSPRNIEDFSKDVTDYSLIPGVLYGTVIEIPKTVLQLFRCILE